LARRASNSLLRPISNVDDLLNLLRARSAIEGAIAAEAARSPQNTSLEALGSLCRRHADLVGSAPMIEQPGLEFHRSMVEMSTNPMLKGAAGMLLAPHFDHIESVLDSILATRQDEERVVVEHEHILDRLRKRDPAGAEAAMKAHFEAMIAATELSIVGGNGALVQRLLELAR
jgi:DNA-binding FadR family transcriptional regulator